jgi:hypothetical protein
MYNKEILEINGRMATVDIEKLSKGLYDLHCEDEDRKAVLCFGMLDAKLCEIMETQLKDKIFEQFSLGTQALFKIKIENFCNKCFNEICKGVYNCAKNIMIV